MSQQQPQRQSNQPGMPGMLRRNFIAQQQTIPQPAVSRPVVLQPQQYPVLPTIGLPNTPLPVPVVPLASAPTPNTTIPSKKKRVSRIIAGLLVVGLAGAIYFIWHTSSSPAPTSTASVSQQNFSTTSTSASTTNGIKVYVVGAVKNPGLYTLATDARVYDLLQAAGGTLPKANLVAINMAAKLSDGQEVYVSLIGEAPPTYTGGVPGPGGTNNGGNNTNGQLVNINTASVDELSQNLHISKKSAQTIVDYRTQHGNYSSVDQLAQAVSTTIYNKIKALCTV